MPTMLCQLYNVVSIKHSLFSFGESSKSSLCQNSPRKKPENLADNHDLAVRSEGGRSSMHVNTSHIAVCFLNGLCMVRRSIKLELD
uniref:Uncharacterized protein n=1 Tax=Pyxicephalus adspersus TaxID=30357 RepID=A0AAV2ZU09_PYXAD|nr:TPA: hypothetical protein GDO54_016382 [Pyxicephalus adspersus]